VEAIKKRKWIKIDSIKYYEITKGPKYQKERKKLEADLTFDLLKSGNWKTTDFKEYNFNAAG
jgi:phenylalanyl-tRNA synthetase alpha chain